MPVLLGQAWTPALWNPVAIGMPLLIPYGLIPTHFSVFSVLSLLSRSTGHISDAEPHVERLFVAGEIGVFDQLLQDSSEHHDHVL